MYLLGMFGGFLKLYDNWEHLSRKNKNRHNGKKK
jgi:hypothetical protein